MQKKKIILSTRELQELTRRKIGHYEFNSESYQIGTVDHDVSQNYKALLDSIESEIPFKILEFGFGPGRDLRYFKSLGHIPTGIEGSETFVNFTRTSIACDMHHMNFINLDLPQFENDGIFANATLFHLPRQEINRVMIELHETLKERGVLFCSNPRGNNQEGFSGERYCFYYTWKEICLNTGFEEIKHFYRPDGIPEEDRPWLASVWRK